MSKELRITPITRTLFLMALLFHLGVSQSAEAITVVKGSGTYAEREIAVGRFNKLELSGSGKVYLSQGEKESLHIRAEDNLLPLIAVNLDDGVLSIGFDKPINPTKTIVYHIQTRELEKVELSGAINLEVVNLATGKLNLNISGASACNFSKITAQDVRVNISGTGRFTVEHLEADTVRADLGGISKVKLQGKAGKQNVDLSGSGQYNAGNLQTQSSSISISGLGKAKVWAEQALNASISGMGQIDYWGNPQLKKNVSGLGKINGKGIKTGHAADESDADNADAGTAVSL